MTDSDRRDPYRSFNYFPTNEAPSLSAGLQLSIFELNLIALLRIRLPLSCEFLRFGDLRGGHASCDKVSKSCRTFSALRRRQGEPHVRADFVLRDTKAVIVEHSEIVLGVGIALLG
jgi:hypothetical protein